VKKADEREKEFTGPIIRTAVTDNVIAEIWHWCSRTDVTNICGLELPIPS
jgi:hypothetical protein